MEKTVSLKDGRRVTIRDMRDDDIDRSFAFFSQLPEEDRKYLRADVTRWEVVERRIRDIDAERVVRLVAVEGDEIVADGALEVAGHGWGDNIAEIRLIVGRPYQRLGLGSLLARELYFIGAEKKVDRIVARVMRPQEGARRILHRLGFHEEFLIPEHVRDLDGRWQDLIIMRCNLEDLWNELENVFVRTDWEVRG
jgi:ribosomal protein S18 acetylase RimI-like enzyme